MFPNNCSLEESYSLKKTFRDLYPWIFRWYYKILFLVNIWADFVDIFLSFGIKTIQKMLKFAQIMSLEEPQDFKNFYLVVIHTYLF